MSSASRGAPRKVPAVPLAVPMEGSAVPLAAQAGRRARAFFEDGTAQATVEAAFALPVLMLLFLMLLQPGIVLYDRMVMSGAAAEGCRLLASSGADEADLCEDYIRRRLSAIPQIDIFHMHSDGCSYRIELSGDETSETVSVGITNNVKPLPLLDMTMSLAGMTDASGGFPVSVESASKTQPSWVAGSADGRDLEGWVGS